MELTRIRGMRNSRSNKISILIVPEGNTEPYSFRLRTGVVKALYGLGFVLLVHIVVGAYFYMQYFELNEAHRGLIVKNTQLREDNKRVIALADQFYALERDYEKVRLLLGVEQGEGIDSGLNDSSFGSNSLFDDITPAVHTEPQSRLGVIERRGLAQFSPKKSKLHDYARSAPTLLPVRGILTQDFQGDGWFGPHRHNGIDVVAKKGTIIRAAGAGMIIFASWTYDLGNLVIVDHGDGLFSYYGHNQRILKPEKGFVEKGEPISLLGNSGKSSGPHLHFEIWKNGEPVDPKDYILAFNRN